MPRVVEIRIPDIGDFEDVELIVAPGERVAAEDSLISIESDKATLEIPAPHAGVVLELCVALGDRVSEGHLIARLELAEDAASTPPPPSAEVRVPSLSADLPAPSASAEAAEPAAPTESGTPPARAGSRPRSRTPSDGHAEVAVIGGGPGGYTAAFRAADLGRRVTLIERYPTLGGVCLNVGCIPSKALLHLAELINEAREAAERGIDFGEPRIDLPRVREFVSGTVGTLTRGLGALARRRRVEIARGTARFTAPDQLLIEGEDGARTLSFDDCIIAAGSRPVELTGAPRDDPRVLDSSGALRLDGVPDRLLIVGGGIIGLEMATVYHALGSRVSVVELLDGLLSGCDSDLVRPLQARIERRYEAVYTGTRVLGVDAEADGLRVRLEGPAAPESAHFDALLVAVGRRSNADRLDLPKAGVETDEGGFVRVDERLATSAERVYAIGDIAGPPMLAHKAIHEGKTAAEVIAGLPAASDPRSIPSVAYTDPEVAWTGLTEDQARIDGTRFDKAVFPWSASGRALGSGAGDGLTKILVDPETRRLLGAGMVGRNAGELIAAAVLGLEMDTDAEDLGLTVHPHPTLSETLGLAAELVEGTVTDLYAPRK